MKDELAEYRVEFRASDNDEWSSFTPVYIFPEEARAQLAFHRKEYPKFQFRLAMRIVHPWCECKEGEVKYA